MKFRDLLIKYTQYSEFRVLSSEFSIKSIKFYTQNKRNGAGCIVWPRICILIYVLWKPPLLLDLYEPSADLFTRHLSTVASSEQDEEPNIEEILDESDTEELISLVQQRFSINQSLSENQQMQTSIRMQQFDPTAPRYVSGGSLMIPGERPPTFEISGVLTPLEEETPGLVAEEVTCSPVRFAPENDSPRANKRKPSMLPNEDDFEDLMAKYDDLSILGFADLLGIPKYGDILSSNRSEIAPSRQISVLPHLKDIGPFLNVDSAFLPAGVAELMASMDDEGALMLRSIGDKKDYVDSKEKDLCRATSVDDPPISMGEYV